ncbi:hypothetical protein HYC85_028164 [Camellia sinensis]|uniref:Uncharacterized protein n=1 Tax=Camellia sinensis TaxID=4442 RepID=A0A7J7FUC6_CAMSI|nr:hypothetical protein HYC85_028164 [Camellia sinensis]
MLAYNRVELSWINMDLSYRQNQTQIGTKCISVRLTKRPRLVTSASLCLNLTSATRSKPHA